MSGGAVLDDTESIRLKKQSINDRYEQFVLRYFAILYHYVYIIITAFLVCTESSCISASLHTFKLLRRVNEKAAIRKEKLKKAHTLHQLFRDIDDEEAWIKFVKF